MAWTNDDVEMWLVHAERADPRIRNPGEARPLEWPERFVEDENARKALKLWIWCEARGYGFSGVCNRRGHAYSTWRRRKLAAVAQIVGALNYEASLKNHSDASASSG